ncbi:MAG: hypothetical protein M3126_04480 [Candidatus Eremiobacteraeota bacterium]|nr:hypothetical protein [Candidatus Eremiobacteraeota bacterium]
MEQALKDIQAHVPDFAGYDDEATRRTADEQIRAVVGEAIALLHFNHPDYFESGPLTDGYDRLILRCEFTNQVMFKEFEYAAIGQERQVAIARADQELIKTSLRAKDVAANDLPRYLSDLEMAFDARERSLTNT